MIFFCILTTMPGRSFLKRFSIILLSPVNRRRCTCFQFALCAVKYQGRKIGNQLILRSIACQTCNYSFSNDSSSSCLIIILNMCTIKCVPKDCKRNENSVNRKVIQKTKLKFLMEFSMKGWGGLEYH